MGRLLGVLILKSELHALVLGLSSELMLQSLGSSAELELRSLTQPSCLPRERLGCLGEK